MSTFKQGRNLVLSVISFNSVSRQIKFSRSRVANPNQRSRPDIGIVLFRSSTSGHRKVSVLADVASKLLSLGHVQGPKVGVSSVCFIGGKAILVGEG